MNLQDLNNLDPNNIGSWPAPAKAVVIVLLCVAVLAGGYFLIVKDQVEKYETVQKQEGEKLNILDQKQRKAANLEPLTQQLEEMKQSFGAMLRQLPNKSEIEGLLVDISQTGLASGLEFELFKPLGEKQVEFYAEKPITIRVTGTYHEFGEFVSGVAALPRIVTLHDISIRPGGKSPAGEATKLILNTTAKTYRYLEEGG